jgi:hypothetical protein
MVGLSIILHSGFTIKDQKNALLLPAASHFFGSENLFIQPFRPAKNTLSGFDGMGPVAGRTFPRKLKQPKPSVKSSTGFDKKRRRAQYLPFDFPGYRTR